MNGLKVRKLAAVVAGGALLGAAVAPMVSAITSSEAKSLVYNTSMEPQVNIVVGKNAAVSDGIWAGNIARAVVANAVMTQTYTGGAGGSGSGTAQVTNLSAVLALGGNVTVTGGKTFDTANLDSVSSTPEYTQSITKDPLSFLWDKSVSYKYNGSTSSIDVKETVGVKLNAKFDTDSDVRDLVAKVSANDVNYTLNLGSGIPLQETDSAVADFVDDSDDNVRIPFFGKTFLVQKIDVSSTGSPVEVRLIEDKAKQTFVKGDSFNMEGKGQYAGQTLKVTVFDVVASGPAAESFEAKFTLTDEAGNVIDSQQVEAGNFVEFEDDDGDEVISGDIYVDSAAVSTGTSEGSVDVLVGTSSIRLLDGENYPYNEDADADNVDGPYTVTLTGDSSDSNRLTQIVISNQEKDDDDDSTSGEVIAAYPASVFDSDNPLYAKNGALTEAGQDGQSEFSFLDGTGALGEDFFKISFNGFEQDEEQTYVKVGNNEISFKDAQDSSHKVPFWWAEDSVSGSAITGNSDGKKFSFDESQDLWYDLNTSAVDFNVVNGDLLNGVAVNVNTTSGVVQIMTDLGYVDVNSASTSKAIVINGVTYTVPAGASSAGSVGLQADGYIRVADSELDSDVSSTDFVQGLGGTPGVGAGIAHGSGLACTATSCDNVFFYDDSNASNGTLAASTAPMLLPLTGDNYTVAYSYFVSESSTSAVNDGVYFMLYGNPGTAQHTTSDGTTIPYNSTMQNSKKLSFLGTDTAEDGTVDKNFFLPQIDDLGQDDSSTTVFASTFQADENASGDFFPIRFYMDNQTSDISNTDDDDISVPTSDVNYGWSGTGIGGSTLHLDFEQDDSLEAAYTDFGTKISIEGHDAVELWIPENRPQIEFIVSGASTTTTVEGGEELEVDEGDTGTFTTGTQVTVKEIKYTATVVGGDGSSSTTQTSGTPFTYTTPANLNGKAQVYSTDSAVPGPKIIVGGPLVNSLAQAVADQLNADGDMVSGVFEGNIIVAGYTAEDTGQAAQDLISALDAI